MGLPAPSFIYKGRWLNGRTKNPDVELLFGVAGGGSVDGESGKLIKEQLESIISSINSKPMPIKVKIDDSSIKAIKQELQKVTDAAKVSVKVSKSTATSNSNNTKVNL